MNSFRTAPHPITTVLIANRGEIALRVIRTCRRLGLATVAVFSEADAGAPHVAEADRAEPIGAAPPGESYLNIGAILDAARRSGADAIHPGYGFLSENAGFVRAVEAEGLIFIGPRSETVAAMGAKTEARRIAEAAGVPVVPGFHAADDDAALARAAAEIGYPVLLKASAGGGGRGMRRVDDPADLAAALASAREEARRAFGDPTIFVEKLIEAPRHLEVQVFGDGRGGALHFHERDCSVQRNHQKVIEEAPAPNLSETARERLFEAAIRLASAIRYAGAGTVEFVMQAGSDQPYFLEMNTRLQVEHPVTEAICGVDLVELQLRQAAGLPLGIAQDDIRPRGHAIEVRINAERPDKGFLPATGRVLALAAPERLRLDSGIAPGSTVGPHYDSLLAKLIAHGPDRETARRRLRAGLGEMALAGVESNLAFLADCLDAPEFAAGQATTAFLDRAFPGGWAPDPARLLALRGAAALAALGEGQGPLDRHDGFRVTGGPGQVPLSLEDGYGRAELTLILAVPPRVRDADDREALVPSAVRCHREGEVIHAASDGLAIAARVRPRAEARVAARAETAGTGEIRAPLTGLVTRIAVAEGDRVHHGQMLAEMEAMKLLHRLAAPFDGRVSRIRAAAGETVTARTVILELEEVGERS